LILAPKASPLIKADGVRGCGKANTSDAVVASTQYNRISVDRLRGLSPSEVLFGVYEARRKAGRPSLVYCGDDESGKSVVAELIRDVGFDPVDAGSLRIARYTEPLALLVAQLAYEGEGGPELAYRFERFGEQA
jgi:hypothetical protein